MTDRRFRKATYPMSIEDKDGLAQEFAEFGYRESTRTTLIAAISTRLRSGTRPSCTSKRSYTPPTTWNVQDDLRQRKEPPTARIRYAKASAS
jgi:hypothetical protein